MISMYIHLVLVFALPAALLLFAGFFINWKFVQEDNRHDNKYSRVNRSKAANRLKLAALSIPLSLVWPLVFLYALKFPVLFVRKQYASWKSDLKGESWLQDY